MSVPDSRSESVNLVLKQLDHLCRIVMSSRLRAHGIATSYPAAAALGFLEEMPGLSGARLARLATVTPQTMNQILAGLERDGLIKRKPDPEHGRILHVFLTERGLAENRRCEALSDELIEEMQAGMTAIDRKAFLRLMRHCRGNMQHLAKNERDGTESAAPPPAAPRRKKRA